METGKICFNQRQREAASSPYGWSNSLTWSGLPQEICHSSLTGWMKWILTCWVLPGGCKTASNLSGSHSPWSVLEINLDLQGNYLHSLAWESSSDPLKPPVLLPLGRRTRSSSNTIIAPRPSLTMWQFWNGGKSKLQRSCSEEKAPVLEKTVQQHLFMLSRYLPHQGRWISGE